MFGDAEMIMFLAIVRQAQQRGSRDKIMFEVRNKHVRDELLVILTTKLLENRPHIASILIMD
jgi:hypothetical protein